MWRSARENEWRDRKSIDLRCHGFDRFATVSEELTQRKAHGLRDFFCGQTIDIAQANRVVQPSAGLRPQIEYLMQHHDDRFHRIVDTEVLAERDRDGARSELVGTPEQSQHVADLRVCGDSSSVGLMPSHTHILTK
jgi:hypothetical protein